MSTAEEDQRRKFEQLARDIECDEDEGRFKAALKRIAKDGKKKPVPEDREI